MKPTLSNIEKRIEAIEQAPQVSDDELVIRVVEVDTEGRQVTENWTGAKHVNPRTGKSFTVYSLVV